jgi:hypothetical protein
MPRCADRRWVHASGRIMVDRQPIKLGTWHAGVAPQPIRTATKPILSTAFATGLQPAGEIPQTTLEARHNVDVDRRLPVGVTARRLDAGLLRFRNTNHRVQQLVGVG